MTLTSLLSMFRWLNKLLYGDIPQIKVKEAQSLQQAGIMILDVREVHERKAGYISGSKNMPLSQLSSSWQRLPKDKELIVQCRTGNRSQQAAKFLKKQGLTVKNMQGGLLAWQAADLPLKRTKRV